MMGNRVLHNPKNTFIKKTRQTNRQNGGIPDFFCKFRRHISEGILLKIIPWPFLDAIYGNHVNELFH